MGRGMVRRGSIGRRGGTRLGRARRGGGDARVPRPGREERSDEIRARSRSRADAREAARARARVGGWRTSDVVLVPAALRAEAILAHVARRAPRELRARTGDATTLTGSSAHRDVPNFIVASATFARRSNRATTTIERAMNFNDVRRARQQCPPRRFFARAISAIIRAPRDRSNPPRAPGVDADGPCSLADLGLLLPPRAMGKNDDDDLYDELYGDDDDEALPIPAALPPKPAFAIPKVAAEPPPAPAPAPTRRRTSPPRRAPRRRRRRRQRRRFRHRPERPDVGDPDDPDDFKIVLDDTEELYGVGATAAAAARTATRVLTPARVPPKTHPPPPAAAAAAPRPEATTGGPPPPRARPMAHPQSTTGARRTFATARARAGSGAGAAKRPPPRRRLRHAHEPRRAPSRSERRARPPALLPAPGAAACRRIAARGEPRPSAATAASG